MGAAAQARAHTHPWVDSQLCLQKTKEPPSPTLSAVAMGPLQAAMISAASSSSSSSSGGRIWENI